MMVLVWRSGWNTVAMLAVPFYKGMVGKGALMLMLSWQQQVSALYRYGSIAGSRAIAIFTGI